MLKLFLKRFESYSDSKNNNCDHAIARSIQSKITHKQMDVLSGIYRTESTVHIEYICILRRAHESSLSN